MNPEELTRRNYAVIAQYVKSVGSSVEYVLLSGSNAWGADYAVTERSDIDLLLVGSIKGLGEAVRQLIEKKLLEPREQERFKIFEELNMRGKAAFMSTIAICDTVPVSLDFMPTDVAECICSGAPLETQRVGELEVRTAKEFRINPPKKSGYVLDGMTGNIRGTYHAPSQEVKWKEETVGYIADTSIDACTEQTYVLGVMGFFFAIHPILLADTHDEGKRHIAMMRTRIIETLKGEEPIYITRQERMTAEALEGIKTSFRA